MTNQQTQAPQGDEFFNENNEAAMNWFKFEKPGDKTKGKFMSSYEKPAEGVFGPQMIYEIETEDGEMWNVPIASNKAVVVKAMSRAKVGQTVGFLYSGDFINDAMKARGMNAAKTIKCFIDKTFDPMQEIMNEAETVTEESEPRVMPAPTPANETTGTPLPVAPATINTADPINKAF